MIGGLTGLLILGALYSLITSLIERKLLKNGDFAIAVCGLECKDEKPVYRHTEKFLHFDGYKEISVASTVYDLSSSGDEFYIVHYKARTTVKLLYPFKMYEFREL